MEIQVRAYTQADLPALIRIWNEVVEDGVAFPQEELLDASSGAAFFAEQTCTAVAVDRQTGHIYGLYILHPNNVVASNTHARHLYERLGFQPLGVIPGGFRMKDGHYEDICPYYHVL